MMKNHIDYIFYATVIMGLFIWLQVWVRNQIKSMRSSLKLPKDRNSMMGRLALYVNMTVVVVLVLSWFFLESSERLEKSEHAKHAMGLAPTFSYHLKQTGHDLLDPATSENHPKHVAMLEMMKQWKYLNKDIIAIYTLRPNASGKLEYILSTEPEVDKNGREVIQEKPEMRQALGGGTPVMQVEPTYNEWGYTLSVFTSLLNEDGKPEAVLGIDFNGQQWDEHIQLVRFKMMSILLVPLLFLLMFYWIFYRFRTEEAHVTVHKEELRESEERFRRLSEATCEGILISEKGIVLESNEALTKMFGYDMSEIIGSSALRYAHPDYHELIFEKMAAGSEDIYEVIGVRKDGSTFEMEMTGKVCNYKGLHARVTAVRDITAKKRAEEKIHYMAFYDDLTSLPNRKMFLDSLTQALGQANANNRKVAVMFLDLDRFKLINDTFGHAMGDMILQKVAERLKISIGGSAFIARLGGDEFTLYQSLVKSIDDAMVCAQKIVETLSQPLDINGYEVTITTSVGISMYPENGQDVQTLMKNADMAMYQAKEIGRNNYQVYESRMDDQVFERLSLEKDLRKALERDELLLHYQPQVNIQTGKIVGLEALVRWRHPERGMVSPGAFIPVAEDTRLIIPIGEWVLRTACKQNKAWQDAGIKPVRMAVNLSVYQFQQENLVGSIAAVLKETGLDPKYLELEITESIAMQNAERVIHTLNELKRLGVEISIDDFGTGYSSLSYLKNFPINRLKIDRSFVNDITIDRDDAAIAASIIAMAHSLELNVIAEGVETEEQLQFLREKKCDEMQGYLFSRPLPSEEVKVLLFEGKRLVGTIA